MRKYFLLCKFTKSANYVALFFFLYFGEEALCLSAVFHKLRGFVDYLEHNLRYENICELCVASYGGRLLSVLRDVNYCSKTGRTESCLSNFVFKVVFLVLMKGASYLRLLTLTCCSSMEFKPAISFVY